MNCKWLNGNKIKQCGAVDSTVVLSGCELEEFCTSGNYRSCPVFLAKKKIGGKRLSVNQYYFIYSNWARKSAPMGLVGGMSLGAAHAHKA